MIWASNRDYSTSLQKFNRSRHHLSLLFFLFPCSHSAEEAKAVGLVVLQKAAVHKEARWASGMEREDAARDGNRLSLASSCQPLSGFRSSATEWRETNKSEKRQAGNGDTLPRESTCLVDLFLGTQRANYSKSLCGCDEKHNSHCKLRSCSSFCCSLPWAACPEARWAS